MTSISAASASNYQSPLQKLQQELQSEVSDGTISSSDQSALTTALQDIDTSLQQSKSSDQSSGTKPSKDGLKSKIDDLISNEVSNGTLTSDQADELKGVFQSAFAKGPGGPGGAHGAGGRRPVRRRRMTALRILVVDGFDEQQLDRFQHGQDPRAVPPGAAAVAVLVELVLQRERHDELFEQHGHLRASDRLQELT